MAINTILALHRSDYGYITNKGIQIVCVCVSVCVCVCACMCVCASFCVCMLISRHISIKLTFLYLVLRRVGKHGKVVQLGDP